MTQTIFCDEAGFTGNNLLDPAQPFFTYGSVAIDPEDARELVAKTVRDFAITGAELKGQRLLQFNRGQQAITAVLDACVDRALVLACHKRYSLAGKFFEHIFEPVLSEQNSIYYDAGFHRFIANIIFFEALGENRHAVAALEAFQTAIRQRDSVGVQVIFPGNRPRHEYSEVLQEIEAFALCHREAIAQDLASYSGNEPVSRWMLDLSVTALFSLLTAWGSRFESLLVYCDESKPLQQNREHFDMMIGRTDRAFLSIEGKRQSLIFNLAEPIRFRRSTDHQGIQLADVVASAFAYALRYPREKRSRGWMESLSESVSEFSIFPDGARVDLREEQAFVNRLVLRELLKRSLKQQDLFKGMQAFIGAARAYRRCGLVPRGK